jgi:hypothetical protein
MIIFFCNDMIVFNSNLLIYFYYIGFALLDSKFFSRLVKD